MSPATDFLAAADGLNLRSIGKQRNRGFPDAAHQLAEVLPQSSVLLQLVLDISEETLGLLRGVGQDDDIVLVTIEGRVQVVLEGERRGLGVSARGLDRPPAPLGSADLLGVLCGAHSLHNALKPDVVQLRMEGRGWSCEVMAQVGPSKILQVDGSQLSPQALGAGQGRPCLVVLQKLLALVREVAFPDNIFKKEGPLLLQVSQRGAVAFVVQLVDEVAEVNRRHLPPPSPGPLPERPEAGRRDPGTASLSPAAPPPSARRPAPPCASCPAGPAFHRSRSGSGRR